MEKHLHIICLTVPYPVDYGGVFDLFYKLPALQQQGVKIHLHCFNYGRGEQTELNKYCASVQYYARKTGIGGLSLRYPYLVKSRSSEQLAERLLQDDHPIFMEGIHSTYLLHDRRFAQRNCFVRLHNVEHIYYRHLFRNAAASPAMLYYWLESKLLLPYERSIASKATFWTVTEKDAEIYRENGYSSIDFLPLFLPSWQVSTAEGRGHYCLYHGDLSVNENEKAALWLFEEVFAHLSIPFVIAGKNPPPRLIDKLHEMNNVCVIANPHERDMQDLIAKAHINILPSFNATGIKLKLVNALFNGKHCVVNMATVEGSGLIDTCHICDDAASFRRAVEHLYPEPFPASEIALRQELLTRLFDNAANARQMVQWIWGGSKN